MVLELKVPHGEDFSALLPLWPVFSSYVLSFIFVGIYWNNLHNMFHAVQRVDGRVLWANLHLLFWLSLMPVSTAFMGENHFAPAPVAIYGIDLTLCAAAYWVLATQLHRLHAENTAFAKALGDDRKGRFSLVLCVVSVLLSFISPWLGLACYVAAAATWLAPDQRFENQLE